MFRLIICPNFKFLALVVSKFFSHNVICLINKKKKKCRNRHNLFLRVETACPDACKFETFIPLVRLVFELELFKPAIGILVFGSETRIAGPINPKICTKKDSYVPHVSFKI